ncbi:uncharacterized protein At5g39570-like [Aristolochia californica]|uniref:uncharacterized protein At5g39570-like n=1 Tax=Aristolochia californica TaxID=171875 RepID=UPI0035D53E17
MASDPLSDFNEIEFREYNPTPYKGGYDIAQTYGEPLLPSDALCYPRSLLAEVSGNREIIPVFAGDEYEQDGVPADKWFRDGSNYEDIGQGNWAGATVPVCCCDLGWGDIFSYDYGGHVEGERYRDSHGGEGGTGSDQYYGLPDPQLAYDSLGIMSYMDSFGGSCDGGLVQQARDYSYDQTKQNPWKETADYLFGNSNSYGDYGSSYDETYSEPSSYEHASITNHQSSHYKYQSYSSETYPQSKNMNSFGILGLENEDAEQCEIRQ